MGNLIIATPVISDAAIVTGAATSSSMTVANLQAPQPTDRCRFASLTGMYSQWDLGSAQAVNYIWHGYSNASVNCTVRRRAATTAGGLTSAPAVDVTTDFWCDPGLDAAVWTRRHSFIWLDDAPETYQFWRFDYTDAANADGYLEIGRAYLANPWQPTQNAEYGASPFIREEVRRRRAEGGPLHAFIRSRDQGLTFTCSNLPEAEALANYYAISRLRGVSEDVQVWLKPDSLAYAMEYSVYGLLSDVSLHSLPAYDQHTVSFTVEEMP